MPNRKQHRGLSVPARPVPPADARRIVYVCQLRCETCAARNTIRWMSDTAPPSDQRCKRCETELTLHIEDVPNSRLEDLSPAVHPTPPETFRE